MKITTKY
jgi:hypothetical protein